MRLFLPIILIVTLEVLIRKKGKKLKSLKKLEDILDKKTSVKTEIFIFKLLHKLHQE